MTIWKNFITIPSTAMGIWVYCICPKIGSMALYFSVIFWIAAIAMTREIWDRKLQMPKGRYFPASLPWIRKLCPSSRTAFMWYRYQTASAAVSICPSTVATAAPIIPQRNTKMNTGSKMILASAPAKVEAIANLGLPSERMIGLRAWPNI